jgi:hypothetical protein
MNPLKEDDRSGKHDRHEDEEPQLVPPDIDTDQGDEGKKQRTDLPPAMPPMI